MKGAGVLIEKGRFFWDAAGPVFPHQVQGLLGYGVTIEWVVYGSVGRRLAAQMDARVRGADDEIGAAGLPIRATLHIRAGDPSDRERDIPLRGGEGRSVCDEQPDSL